MAAERDCHRLQAVPDVRRRKCIREPLWGKRYRLLFLAGEADVSI